MIGTSASGLLFLDIDAVLNWFTWLSRRSQRRRRWDCFNGLLQRLPLPRPRIVHSYVQLATNST